MVVPGEKLGGEGLPPYASPWPQQSPGTQELTQSHSENSIVFLNFSSSGKVRFANEFN